MPFGATALLLVAAAMAVPVSAQEASDAFFGQTVTEVRFEFDGRPGAAIPNEASLRDLVDVRPGQPLRRDDVRSSMDHLFALGRYEDIRPLVTSAPAGVVVLFRLVPRYPIDRIDVNVERGSVSSSTLTSELRQRFVGRQPGTVRIENVEDFVHQWLNDEGYLDPVVSASTVLEPDDDAATLVVRIQPGEVAEITSAKVENSSPLSDTTVLNRAAASAGSPYRRRDIQSRLTAIEDDLRNRGYYEAQATIAEARTAAGVALTLNIQAGPRVELRVEPPGALPGSAGELIPIARERSADQDLLEDARSNIESVLKRDGYAEASAPFTSELSADRQVLTVSFTITRGPRHYVERVELPPGLSISEPVLRKLIGLTPGTLYDQARFESGVTAAIDEYRRRGYYQSAAEPSIERVPLRNTATEAWVVLHPNITEGPRAQIAAVTFAFEGTHRFTEPELRQQLMSKVGAPYVEFDAVRDQDGLLSHYRNLGFLSAAVALERRIDPAGTSVELAFTVNEGPQIIIGRITVLGHERVSEQQILEELQLRSGQPLGTGSLAAARQRLADMGVFRSFSVEAADRLSGETEGHVVVTVVEAPATTIAFGFGVEGGSRAKLVDEGPAVQDVIEFVPRGFFEIGRRNLGGRNRAVNLFTRVGLRRSDRENLSQSVQEFQFIEYRVTGTFREHHAFRSDTDLLVSMTSEQAVRPTYNYVRRAASAEFLRRLTPRVNFSGRYTLDFTELFDERIPEEDQPLIDRLFPQVRLSYVASGVSWDGRDSPLTPVRGLFVSADGELAARAIGSEVGYLKGFFQALNFRPIGSTGGTVLALRGLLGLARGFEREVEVVDEIGIVQTGVVKDLPVSQRFFAGGGTTVRGFQLDRLGIYDPTCIPCSVINPATGLSVGGNAVIVLNAEVRRTLRAISQKLAAVAFLDGGNVFPEASDLDLSRIRGTAGVGVRYDSPFGPLRLDFGFKMDRLIIAGRRESAWEYHLSIGEIF
jgi:outer membrane protein assembly factor BamA